MKFGLSLFGYAPRFYATVSKAAEDHGFESVWMQEHLVFPEVMPPTYLYTESGYPPVDPDTALFDVWVVLSNIAQATETIRLGTNVYVLPLRHPLITARSVVTLDRLSNGRVTLGVGVGWLEEEFTAVGLGFKDRGKRTDEIIPLLRRLWSDDVIDHRGEHFQFGPVKFQPKPRQANLPIEVGGASKPALRRAGRLGDGWIEIGSASLDEAAERLAVVQAARVEAGRDRLPFEVTMGGKWATSIDGIKRAAEAGATRIVLGPPVGDHERPSPEATIEWVKRFQNDVIAHVG